MCGITGFLDPRHHYPEHDALVHRMMDAVRHRGPDDDGAWLEPASGIALGHRRLSIIDLSPLGHQPMTSASGRYVIAFNGEIYNYRELRRALETKGITFRSHSDTEVILEAASAWGFPGAMRAAGGNVRDRLVGPRRARAPPGTRPDG